MTDDDIVAGKGGFQKADLMDYGSLYGMGSYYGEDYTASTLVRLGTATQNNIAAGRDRQALRRRSPPTSRRRRDRGMQRALQGVDLTKTEVVLPAALAAAIVSVRDDLAKSLNIADPASRLDAGLQPQPAARAPDGGFPGLLRADHGGAAAGRDLVLDRELAL